MGLRLPRTPLAMMTAVYKTVLPLIVVLLATQVASQELSSTLHSTLYGVQFAFVDETVVFTCVVRGSNNLLWTSDEYIGVNRRVNLAAALSNGTTVPVFGRSETEAVLVNATADVIIVAQLRIRVQSTYPVASIQCTNIGISVNDVNSTSFRLASGALVACDRQSVCPGDTLTCACATGNSDTLAWVVNGTTLTFAPDNPVSTRRGVNGSTTFDAVLTDRSSRNGVNVLMSNLTVSVSKSSRARDSGVLLVCENVDGATPKPTIVPLDETCPVIPSDQVTTSAGGENVPVTCSTCTGSIVGVIIVAIIAIAALVAIIIVAVIFYQRKLQKYKDKSTQNEEEMQRLTKENSEKEKQTKTLVVQVKEKESRISSLEGEIVTKDEIIHTKENEIQRLKEDLEKSKKYVEEFKKQMEQQHKRAEKELVQKMKQDQDAVLKRFKAKVKEEVKHSLTKETRKEITEAFKTLDDKLEQEVKKILDSKEETWAEMFGSFITKCNDILGNLWAYYVNR